MTVITNDKRIVESLPTIKYILTTAAELFFAHLGRPKGEPLIWIILSLPWPRDFPSCSAKK